MKTIEACPEQGHKIAYYRIGGYLMRITMPFGMDVSVWLPSFTDFIEDCSDAADQAIGISLHIGKFQDVLTDQKVLVDQEGKFGRRFTIEEYADAYLTTVYSRTLSVEWQMTSTKDFSCSTIYMSRVVDNSAIFPWLLKLAFGQAIIFKKGMLIHASVIALGEIGIAFLGKSGVGKSTHSQQWKEQIAGSRLLNDDNPLMRVNQDGEVSIYGTPWSGKTSCYVAEQKTLKAIVRLEQGDCNRLTWITGKEAFLTLVPSVLSFRWNKDAYNLMLDSLEQVVQFVSIGAFTCMANAESANYCYQEVLTR
ncbi:hypothetical protein [Sphingobacterium ginsenosidimutans]|uniref:Phosphoenolpyruvate carboxykinase n=1 Tax=Sphingobacterium ginsenosidimutans TaxID=687845 RepID=A0ABP7ZQP0_9SPHI